MALSKERKAELVKKFGKNEKDTGSIQVQVALLTEQIKALTAHLKKNHKDAASKRGLMILVGQRRSLLDYLVRTDRDAYLKLIVDLGLRKPQDRKNDFEPIEFSMSDEEADQECSRCLRCDHFGFGAFRGGRSTKW